MAFGFFHPALCLLIAAFSFSIFFVFRSLVGRRFVIVGLTRGCLPHFFEDSLAEPLQSNAMEATENPPIRFRGYPFLPLSDLHPTLLTH